MSLDDATDAPLDALAAMIAAHVNGETAAALGEPAIRHIYKHPAPLQVVSSLQLPALSVVRGPVRYRDRVTGGPRARQPFTLVYITPSTPFGQLGDRWPLLELVWSKILEVAEVGESAHAPGADLAAAGYVEHDLGQATKQDQFADVGGTVYPAFTATLHFWIDPVPDLSGLTRLQEVLASYFLPAGGDGPALTVVQDLIEVAPQPAPPAPDEPDFPGED